MIQRDLFDSSGTASRPEDRMSFAQAVRFVHDNRGTEEGCFCPVCGAHNKVKKYKLMRQHFNILDVLAQAGVGQPVHCRKFAGDGQAYNKMLNIPRHYGFISQQGKNADNPFDRSGEWSITNLGLQFAGNLIRVPAHFWGLHDRVLWWHAGLYSREEMSGRLRYSSPKTLIEEMATASVSADDFRGTWRTEPTGMQMTSALGATQ